MNTISSEFALEFALLARGAVLLQREQPRARPTTIRRFSANHKAIFWAAVSSVEPGNTKHFRVKIYAGVDSSVPLHETIVALDPDLVRDLALAIEWAEEELVCRNHREKLVSLLAEKAPDPDELHAYCEKVGISADGSELTVEECAMISAWLEVPEMREKALRAPPSGRTGGLDRDFF